MIKAENADTYLKTLRHNSLLIAIVLKRLLLEFKSFTIVITQKEKLTFSEFNVPLRSFEKN